MLTNQESLLHATNCSVIQSAVRHSDRFQALNYRLDRHEEKKHRLKRNQALNKRGASLGDTILKGAPSDTQIWRQSKNGVEHRERINNPMWSARSRADGIFYTPQPTNRIMIYYDSVMKDAAHFVRYRLEKVLKLENHHRQFDSKKRSYSFQGVTDAQVDSMYEKLKSCEYHITNNPGVAVESPSDLCVFFVDLTNDELTAAIKYLSKRNKGIQPEESIDGRVLEQTKMIQTLIAKSQAHQCQSNLLVLRKKTTEPGIMNWITDRVQRSWDSIRKSLWGDDKDQTVLGDGLFVNDAAYQLRGFILEVDVESDVTNDVHGLSKSARSYNGKTVYALCNVVDAIVQKKTTGSFFGKTLTLKRVLYVLLGMVFVSVVGYVSSFFWVGNVMGFVLETIITSLTKEVAAFALPMMVFGPASNKIKNATSGFFGYLG